MNELIFNGRITIVSETKSGTSQAGKDWAKKDFIVTEQSGDYPNSMKFTCFKTEQFPNIVLGKDVSVKFDCKVREYESKYYQDISAYSVTLKEGQQLKAPQPAPIEPEPVLLVSNSDDLPF